jgi:hypothetical protein
MVRVAYCVCPELCGWIAIRVGARQLVLALVDSVTSSVTSQGFGPASVRGAARGGDHCPRGQAAGGGAAAGERARTTASLGSTVGQLGTRP